MMTTIARKREIKKDLLGVFVKALDERVASKRDVTRIKFLRPSQLPFCPASFFVNHATQGMVSTQDLLSAFYTQVGTVVHSVLQRYLSPSGRFLADWRCRLCGRRRKMSTNSECCDFTMDYDELEINHKGVVGHIDAVFKDKHGRYWILDFKTATLKGAVAKAKSPGRVYSEQVETYALMLRLQYGIKVEGVLLMFVPRDDPKEPTVWVRLLDNTKLKVIKARVKGYKAQHKEALNAETVKEAVALARFGRCANPYCKVCKSTKSLKTQLKEAHTKGIKKGYVPLIDLK